MIPILFEGNAIQFNNNGLGRLADAISCTVEEERNGTFELLMKYPITGVHYSDIAVNRIILAKTEDGGTNQAFIIYKISKPINGIVTINAEHISYLLNGFVIMPFSAVSLADAMSKINTYAVLNTGFTFSTDISNTKPYKLETPKPIRNILGGEEGSFLDVYGGADYYFNNFNVQLLASRGSDNGVTIRYGKNLTELKAVSDATNIYTGIVPFWADTEGQAVYVDDYVVYSEHAETYPYKYIKVVDFTNDFETQPSKAQLLARAQAYLANNDGWKIKHNIDVSFVNLAQTEDYKDIAPLERVKLCDIVSVVYTKLGISFKTKVIKTVYNVLLEKYDSIELGDATYTLAKALQQANDTPTIAEQQSAIQKAVNHATSLIRGGLGGHVVMMADGDGLPQEILIMDTDDISTATKVWRWNMGGLGYSNTGYEGTYGTAITMDGQIVANYITAGTFNGALIQAGTISADALSVEAKQSLQAIHDYIPLDSASNASHWWHATVHSCPVPYEETIDGKTYVVLDGTSLTAFSSSEYGRVQLDNLGNLKVTLHMSYHFDHDFYLENSQRFILVHYKSLSTQEYRIDWWGASPQQIESDRIYEFNNNYTNNDIDISGRTTFGLYYVPGAKIYIDEMYVESPIDVYAASGIEANAEGLELYAEKYSVHDYLPYDFWVRLSRWHYVSYQGLVPPQLEYIQSVKYLILDGTNISSYSSNASAYVYSDFVGISLPITIKMTVKFSATWTVPDDTHHLLYLYYKDPYDVSHFEYFTLPNGTTYQADTEYTLTWDAQISALASHDQEIHFVYMEGLVTYYKEFTAKSDLDAYTKASLMITADGLNSVVQKGSVISTINQSAEQITIAAGKIDLTGALSLHGDFTTYAPNDNTTKAYMDSGSIKFYKQGANVFTIAPIPLLGQNAGIFFGEAEDPYSLIRMTYITQDYMQVPTLLVRKDGSQTQPTGAGQALIEGDFSVFGSSIFYGNVYNANSQIVFVSDRRKKRNIKDLVIEKAKSFLMKLKPREYKYIKGISTSDRKHHGFIAQEVREAMHEDWGLYVDDEEIDFIGLRYDELIADIVAVVQEQEKRIDALERALNDKSNNQS